MCCCFISWTIYINIFVCPKNSKASVCGSACILQKIGAAFSSGNGPHTRNRSFPENRRWDVAQCNFIVAHSRLAASCAGATGRRRRCVDQEAKIIKSSISSDDLHFHLWGMWCNRVPGILTISTYIPSFKICMHVAVNLRNIDNLRGAHGQKISIFNENYI